MSLTSVGILVLAILPIIIMIPAHADSEECVMIRKASTQELYCVFPSSVAPLYERGWGTPGKAWGNVCDEETLSIGDGCVIKRSYDPLQRCKIAPGIEPCISLNRSPRTVQDCLDKYVFGYLRVYPFGIGPVISVQEYASEFCYLVIDASAHGEKCSQWWQKYQDLSTDHPEQLSEGGFIYTFCLEPTEPDWDSWGEFTVERIGSTKEYWGPLVRMKQLAFLDCHDQPCPFVQQNGVTSLIQCNTLQFNTFNTTQFVRNPETHEYTCQEVRNPRIDCPEISSSQSNFVYNDTHSHSFEIDAETMKYTCPIIPCPNYDCSPFIDRYN